MKNTKQSLRIVEQGVLGPLASLAVLEIEACLDNAEILRNLTGCEVTKSLTTVQLNRNKIHKLDDSTLSGLSGVKQFFMQSSGLQSIHISAFRSFSRNIEKLSLNGNQLKSLDRGVFDNIPLEKAYIDLRDNEWHCNCKLKWLSEVLKKYENIPNVKCVAPQKYRGNYIRDAEYCTETTTVTPEYLHTGMYDFDCSECGCPSSEVTTQNTEETKLRNDILITRSRPDFNISQQDGYVRVDFGKSCNDCKILYYKTEQNDFSKIKLNCERIQNQKSIMIEIDENTNYRFCLVNSQDYSVDPLDCSVQFIETISICFMIILGIVAGAIFILLVCVAWYFIKNQKRFSTVSNIRHRLRSCWGQIFDNKYELPTINLR